MPTINVSVTVSKSKAFDDLSENVSDLRELLELVPAWQQAEAQELAERIHKRHLSWVTIDQGRAR